MKFRSYVPQAVRVSTDLWLEGKGYKQNGLNSALAKAEADLLRIEQQRDKWANDETRSNQLRIEQANATNHRDDLAADVACLQRLVHDPRMQPAYAKLANLPNVTDDDLSGFIHAAWAARIDYTAYRDAMTDAADTVRKVAAAAGVLAELLSRADSTGWHDYLPAECFDLRSLLKKTEHAPADRNFQMWPDMRAFILGEAEPAREAPGEAGVSSKSVRVEFVPLSHAERRDPEAETRNMLRYAWYTAPSMAKIIAAMQRETLSCIPSEPSFIAQAVNSRKKAPKAAYLRAFGTLLRDEHGFDLEASVREAMATTATVVLNDANDSVCTADVSSALTRIGA